MLNQETGSRALAGGEAAGFGVRLGAYLIDLLVLAVPQILLILALGILGRLLGIILGAGYFVYFWSSYGATPGKMLLGLRVVNAETGDTIDAGTAILRYVGYIVSGLAIFLGFLWIIWDEKKQGWHDKIAKARVVRV